MQVQPRAEIFAVCRLGDESGSPPAEPAQRVLALGIDIEHFPKIENLGLNRVLGSSHAKEFLGPQAG